MQDSCQLTLTVCVADIASAAPSGARTIRTIVKDYLAPHPIHRAGSRDFDDVLRFMWLDSDSAMVQQLRLICLVSLCVLATGCCCVPGPMCGGCPLPLPIPVPTLVPVPLPLPVLSGACVANVLNSPLHPPICGGMQCCSDPCCAAPVGGCAHGPAPWSPAQSCGDSCGEGLYGYGAPTPSQPIYPDAYSTPHSSEPFQSAPASQAPVPVPQDNLPENVNDASAYEATGIRRTNWEFSQAEVNSRVVLPGQRVSNREMRVQHVVGSPNAVSVLRIPGQ